MNENFERIRKSVNWGGKVKHVSLLVVLALVLSLVMPLAAPLTQPAARIQPLLLEMAGQQPDQVVSVIVQKAVKDDRVEKAVDALSGRVTKDLHIINSFVAEMKVKDVAQLAKADGVRWVSFDAPVKQAGVVEFTSWATTSGTAVVNSFSDANQMIDSTFGPNGTFGSGSATTASFGGFEVEAAPGNSITKVELMLYSYVPTGLDQSEDIYVTPYVNGLAGESVILSYQAFSTHVGASTADIICLDITASQAWEWSDFENGFEIVLDQTRLASNKSVYYDAVGLRITSNPGNDTSIDWLPAATPTVPVEPDQTQSERHDDWRYAVDRCQPPGQRV